MSERDGIYTPIGETKQPSFITVVQTGRVRNVPFTEGMTVAQALSQAEMRPSATDEIRVNNAAISGTDQVLRVNDQVMFVGKISGGSF